MEPQSVQRIERGTNLTLRGLTRLARIFGVKTIALLEAPHTPRGKPGRPKKEQRGSVD